MEWIFYAGAIFICVMLFMGVHYLEKIRDTMIEIRTLLERRSD